MSPDLVGGGQTPSHVIVFEGVAQSYFPLKAVVFKSQKRTLLTEIAPFNTLAWRGGSWQETATLAFFFRSRTLTYTLNLTPCTLHLAPQTLHLTACAIHPKPQILNPTLESQP